MYYLAYKRSDFHTRSILFATPQNIRLRPNIFEQHQILSRFGYVCLFGRLFLKTRIDAVFFSVRLWILLKMYKLFQGWLVLKKGPYWPWFLIFWIFSLHFLVERIVLFWHLRYYESHSGHDLWSGNFVRMYFKVVRHIFE